MKAIAAHDRLRGSLRAELNRHYGRIGEIEHGLDRAEGYLGKYCRGEISIPVDVLLRTLELIEVEPGRFFAQTLGTPTDSSAHLRRVMAAEPGKPLARLREAATEAAVDVPPSDPSDLSGVVVAPSPEPCPAAEAMVEDFMTCSALEQRRRLRSTKKYRTAAFVRAYLKRLNKLAYKDPKVVAKQAEVVGVDLVPAIDGIEPAERLALLLQALGVWVFASRVTSAFAQAALGVHIALDLAATHGLDRIRAHQLVLGALVLSDNGLYVEALQLFDEALVIWRDLDEPLELAKVQVQRGGTLSDLGEYAKAVRVLEQALGILDGHDPAQRLYRLAAYQRLSRVHEHLDDIDRAEDWLEKAIAALDADQKINAAKLVWQVGRLNVKRGALKEAEERLTAAFDVLVECEASECTLVALDLSRVLLSRGEARRAVELARSMAHLVSSSRASLIDQAVLTQFINAAVEGQLSIVTVDRLKKSVEERRARPKR